MPDTAAILLSRLARLVAGEGHMLGLKPVQLQVLRFLAQANRFTRTPGGVTAWLGQTKGTVSQTLATLERKGLVARSPDTMDRRIVRLDLTSTGRTMLAECDDIADRLTAPLEWKDKAALARIVENMLRSHLAQQGHRTMGICSTCRHFEAAAEAGQPHKCALLNVELTDADSALICIEQEAA
jgi:DNA-binding MarR family transcriptional regulator